MEGHPWLFPKQLIIFYHLFEAMNRDNLHLVISPFGVKLGLCPPECDSKDLMHAVGSTFGGLSRSEVVGEYCRIRVALDIQKPLRRGIFVATNDQEKVWLPFKYDNLPQFCFGYGQMGHGLKEYSECDSNTKEMLDDDLPYSLALKSEVKAVGKEVLKFGFLAKKSRLQRQYVGNSDANTRPHQKESSDGVSEMNSVLAETRMELGKLGKMTDIEDSPNMVGEKWDLNDQLNPIDGDSVTKERGFTINRISCYEGIKFG